jgi:hypothetical protein
VHRPRNGVHRSGLQKKKSASCWQQWRRPSWVRFSGAKGSTRRISRAFVSPSKKPRNDEQKRIKDLERELKRKEAALAETAALLVLRKKAGALWGEEGEDT